MANVDEYLAAVERVERRQKESDRARWELERIQKQLLDKFGCKSLDEADNKLRALQAKLDAKAKECDKFGAEYLKLYGEKTDDSD